MKKFLFIFLVIILVAVTLTGCNYQMIDTTYSYEYAIIKLPNGEIIEGPVEKWSDYEGDQLQVKINGKTYLVHSVNATFISED